jgi:hypothetical protein
MPASSSCTGSRPSRSSGSMSRTRSMRRPAARAAPRRGHRQHRQAGAARPGPARGGAAPALAAGMATMTCVAAPRTPGRARPPAAQHRHAGDALPCLAGSSSSRPSTIQPCWWMPASSMRAASPAPITRARRTSVAAGDARAGVLVEHAVGDAHHAHAHQRHHRVQRQHRARHLAPGCRPITPTAPPAARRQRRPGQALHLAEAGEAPHALRHAQAAKASRYSPTTPSSTQPS